MWPSKMGLILEIILTNFASPKENSVTECIGHIIKSFTSTTLVAVSKDNEPKISNVSHMMTNLNIPYIVIDETYDQHYDETSLRLNYGVIFLENQQNVTPILRAIKLNGLISVKMVLLVVVDVSGQHKLFEEVAVSIISDVRRFLNPAMVGIVVFGEVTTNVFWSQFHYRSDKLFRNEENKCDVPQLEKLPRRYPLRVVPGFINPYVLPPLKEGEGFRGLEIQILQAIAKSMDCEVIWVSCPPGELPRVVKNAKGQLTGYLGVLNRLEGDVGFGGMPQGAGRAGLCELLPSHTEDVLKWVIPCAPEIPNLGAIVSVFSSMVWILVVVVLAVFVATLTCVRSYKSSTPRLGYYLYLSLTETIAVLLDQGISLVKSNKLTSYLLLLYGTYCLVITNAYRSSLITALTADFEAKWYETPEEVVADGAIAYMLSSGRPHIQGIAEEDPMWMTLMKENRVRFIDDFAVLDNVAATRSGMVLCITNPCKALILENFMGPNLKPKIIFLKKIHDRFAATMFMAHGSPLFSAFHNRTLWLKEGGLMEHWLDDINHVAQLKAANQGRSSSYHADDDDVEQGPESLSLLHLEPAFVVLSFTLLLSILLFVMEITCCRRKAHKPTRKFVLLTVRLGNLAVDKRNYAF